MVLESKVKRFFRDIVISWLLQDKAIKGIVNPHQSDLVVFSPGAGLNILDPLRHTDGQKFSFVDIADNWWCTPTEALAHIGQRIPRQIGHVEKVEEYGEDAYRMVFWLNGRQRELFYHFHKDARDFTPPEISSGYDAYLSIRAGPFNNPNYLARMIKLMRIGGFFISNMDLMWHNLVVDGQNKTVPTNFKLDDLGLTKVGEVYDFTLIKKVRDAPNIEQHLIPPYFEFAIQYAEGLLKEHETNPGSIYAKREDWRKSLRERISEINDLYPSLGQDLRRKYEPAVSAINERAKSIGILNERY